MTKNRKYLFFGFMILMACILLCGTAFSEDSTRKMTVMVYMCGSNLESNFGCASKDIAEMLDAGNNPREVSVLVMAGGSRMSQGIGYFQSDTTSIYEIGAGRIRNVWTSPEAMSMGDAATLQTLIRYALDNRPAERYALILWNHGGGPLEGVCYDELFSMDSLSLQEMVRALEEARLPGKLSWIGFDACLMGSAEVAYTVSPYAEYMIASQEKEPAAGWDYHFLKDAGKDRDGAETGRRIIDGYTEALKEDPNPLTLSCVDLIRLQQAIPAMDAFFANVSSDIRPETYSEFSILRLDSVGFGKAVRGTENFSYDLVDLQDLVEKLGKNGNNSRLLSLLQDSVVYSRSTVPGATGLSVYHPYSNKSDYIRKWNEYYAGLVFSGKYQDYVSGFGKILTSDVLADWSGLKPETQGRGSLQNLQITLQLTEMQRKTFAKSQILILAAYDEQNGIYSIAGSQNDDSEMLYTPVSVSSAQMDADGKLTAEVSTRTLYATDENGKPVCGPLTYELSDDGETICIQGLYEDQSGREDAADSISVLFSFRMGSGSGPLEKTSVMGYDSASETYTPRIPVEEGKYTNLTFRTQSRKMPSDKEQIPGFEDWEEGGIIQYHSVELPRNWQLRFFDTQMSAVQLYASFQITDNQQNSHSSQLVIIGNPNLESVQVQPRVIDEDDYRLRFFVIRDTSPLDPGLNLAVEITNLSKKTGSFSIGYPVINENQSVIPQRGLDFISVNGLEPRKTQTVVVHLDSVSLTNLTAVDRISMRIDYSGARFFKYVSISVSQCSLVGIAEIRNQVLSSCTRNSLTWELVGLERADLYRYDAVLRVTNHTNSSKWITATCVAEDLLVGDGTDSDVIDLDIPAESMGYVSVSIPDRCLLNSFYLTDKKVLNYILNAENQFAQRGVSEIRSLRIIPTGGYGRAKNYADLILDTPIPVSGGETSELPAGKPLLTGPVEAYVERVFLGDNGIGMRILFVNYMEQNVKIETEAVLNDKYNTDNFFSELYIVPAMGRAVYCIDYIWSDYIWSDAYTAGEKIEKVSLVFYINQMETSPAVVYFPQEAPESRYLSENDYELIPTSFEPERFHFLSAPVTTDDGLTVQVEGTFTRYKDNIRNENPEGNLPLFLKMSVKVTNPTKQNREFGNPRLTINKSRKTDVIFSNTLFGNTKVDAGETIELDEYIPLTDIKGITEIHEITLKFNLQKDLVFPVGPLDTSGMILSGQDFIAEGDNGYMTVQLLSFSEDEKGRLKMGLRVFNHGIYKNIGVAEILLNGVEFNNEMTFLPSLEPGESAEVEVEMENRLTVPASEVQYNPNEHWLTSDSGKKQKPDLAIVPDVQYELTSIILEDYCLERRGISEVSEIRIIGLFGGDIVLIPNEPIRLADKPVTHIDTTGDTMVSVRYSSVFIGENRIYLAMDLINRTDKEIKLTIKSPKVNGEDCSFILSEIPIYLNPHSRTVDTVYIDWNPEKSLMHEGDSVQDITYTCMLEIEKETYANQFSLKLLREAPFGAEKGVLLEGNKNDFAVDADINMEELLLYDPIRTEAETVSPVLLIPALDESSTAMFAEGMATVYLQKEEAHRELVDDGEDGRYEFYPERYGICNMKLVKDDQGQIVSKYSGLACINSQGQILQTFEYSELNKEYDNIWQSMPQEKDTSYAISILHGDVYLERDKYLIYRSKGGTKPDRDGYLFTVNLIETAGSQSSVIDTAQSVYSNGSETELQFETEECEKMYCTALQEIIVPKPDGSYLFKYADRQIVRLGDLRYVPAEALDGSLMVLYQITYQDGRTVAFFEAYP